MSRPRKLIHSTNTNGYEVFSLTVPSEIGKQIPEDSKFSCRLTEEGILFTPYTDVSAQSRPQWLKDLNAQAQSLNSDDGDDDVPVEMQ